MEGTGARIIIKGITQGGRPFRPSDWAQRLATAVATLGPDRRIRFHPRVMLSTFDGVAAVVVDGGLEREDPMLFRFLLNFARDNDLQVATEPPPTPPAPANS